jgi:hypothetical protein
MDKIPSFVFCGLGGLGLSGTFSFDDESQEGSMIDFMNPCGCRDSEGVEAIFRPMNSKDSAENADWSPPLFRDKSLLSTPSPSEEPYNVDVVLDIPSPISEHKEASSSKYYVEQSHEECLNDNFLNPVPPDFVPPKHSFSRSFEQRDEDSEVKQSKTSAPFSYVPETKIEGLLPTDVLCGRGMNTSVHPGKSSGASTVLSIFTTAISLFRLPRPHSTGNLAYKKIIKKYEMEYICSKRSVKPKIAMKLVEDFRRNNVRFVKRERDDNGRFYWIDIGEQRAYEKVCQSLREGAPQLRRQMLATDAIQKRQDSPSKKTSSMMSIASSAREGEDSNREHCPSPKHSNTMPLYHRDCLPDARFSHDFYYQHPSRATHYQHPTAPPHFGGSSRRLVFE